MRTKTKSSQTNGICERFYQRIQDGLYSNASPAKLYQSLEELQSDVDEWMEDYNAKRTHSGKQRYAKMALHTLSDSAKLARNRDLARIRLTAGPADAAT